MKTIGIFADVSDLYYFVGKKFDGRKLDYQKLKNVFTQEGNQLYRAFAYGSQLNREANRFISCLRHIGFEPRYRITNPSQRVNWNVSITLDVVRLIDKLDIVVIASNNYELLPLIDYIKERGVKVIIVSANVCRPLRDACDEFFEISESLLETPFQQFTEKLISQATMEKVIASTEDTEEEIDDLYVDQLASEE